MALNAALISALGELPALLRYCQDDYWIISSAAVALHIQQDIGAADIDLLVSRADGHKLMQQYRLTNQADQRHALFRSSLLLQYHEFALPVEIMAELTVKSGSGWQPIRPQSRQQIMTGGNFFFLPDREELAAMLACFGRPKDLERLDLLAAYRRF